MSGQEKIDKLREAATKYKAALAIKPDDHRALYNLGMPEARKHKH